MVASPVSVTVPPQSADIIGVSNVTSLVTEMDTDSPDAPWMFVGVHVNSTPHVQAPDAASIRVCTVAHGCCAEALRAPSRAEFVTISHEWNTRPESTIATSSSSTTGNTMAVYTIDWPNSLRSNFRINLTR